MNRKSPIITHLQTKIDRVQSKINEMNDVRKNCIECNNVNDAIQIQLMMAPLTVKLASLKEQLYRAQHPSSEYYQGNHLHTNHNNNTFTLS